MMFPFPWDPEVESPASIAVLGAGPLGIETAIYARFLGYFVSVFETRRVGHRMHDWHQRSLAVPVGECTTPLGHAAILSQNPEYVRPATERVFTGKEYVDEYLIPLAKTDLLFDDIHFLSPVVDVSRVRTLISDRLEPQDRCNDEFRILVQGRHRGPWTTRADVIIDCRGRDNHSMGMGPGGGLAIGESELEKHFLKHSPCDRKFERKTIDKKRIVLVGQSYRAAMFVKEFISEFGSESNTRLTWCIRQTRDQDHEWVRDTLRILAASQAKNVGVLEILGVEQILQQEGQAFFLQCIKDDDSTVDLEADAIIRMTDERDRSIAPELNVRFDAEPGWDLPVDRLTPQDSSNEDDFDFVTGEPGYYTLRSTPLHLGAGAGLKQSFESIRKLFAMLGGREDLNLYDIIEKQYRSTSTS